jgi:hypothetical protein
MVGRLRFLIPAVVAAVVCAVPSANAGLLDPVLQLVAPTCGTNGYPFLPVDGDGASYYGFTNNGFESGTSGWSLSGRAGLASANEPWYANGSGQSALSLGPGASATSPSFCINLFDPAIRGFARSISAGGSLQVQVLFRGLTGNLTGVFNYASMSPGDFESWQPTSRVGSGLALPLLSSYAQIRVTNTGWSGTWQVDDLFVDPTISRVG